MRKKRKRIVSLLSIVLLALMTSACQPSWNVVVTDPSGTTTRITNQDVMFYINKSKEPTDVVPLGQLLYHGGYTLVESISLKTGEDEPDVFFWDEIATSAIISESGEIKIGNEWFAPDQIIIKPSNLTAEIDFSILDIAPTVAAVLGLPELPNSAGKVRTNDTGEWDHAVMILLDGLQFAKLETAINNGKLPFFEELDTPKKGMTVYPPITIAASAAVLTGTPPQINGVYGYGYRSTTQTTLFDLAANAGKSVAAIEGASLPFNLRNAETTLSGDRDGDGFSDDNVLHNSLDIIQNEMPDLLYIHFHEIDDMGHNYGPDSPQYLAALQRVDEYLAKIFDALPPDTFIAIFADHGMHATNNGGKHGALTEKDLVIPILFLEK